MQSPKETLEMLSGQLVDCVDENPERQCIVAELYEIPYGISILSPDEMAEKIKRDKESARRAEKRLEKTIRKFKR